MSFLWKYDYIYEFYVKMKMKHAYKNMHNNVEQVGNTMYLL